MTATTTRPISFSLVHPTTKIVVDAQTFPVGTEVYFKARKNGTYSIRVAGSLFTQVVDNTDITF